MSHWVYALRSWLLADVSALVTGRTISNLGCLCALACSRSLTHPVWSLQIRLDHHQLNLLNYRVPVFKRTRRAMLLGYLISSKNTEGRKRVTTVREQCSIRASRWALMMHKAKRTPRQISLLPSVSQPRSIIRQIQKLGTFSRQFRSFYRFRGLKRKRGRVQLWVCGGSGEMPCVCQEEESGETSKRKRNRKKEKEKE